MDASLGNKALSLEFYVFPVWMRKSNGKFDFARTVEPLVTHAGVRKVNLNFGLVVAKIYGLWGYMAYKRYRL